MKIRDKMIDAISSWVFIGTLYLLILTIQDYKNNCWIDSRHNYFMSGYTLCLGVILEHSLWFIAIVISVVLFTSIILRKFNVIGAGDIGALTWIIMGFTLINVYYLFYFYLIFTILYILYYNLKRLICYFMKWDSKKGTPFFAVILISYVCTNILFSLY